MHIPKKGGDSNLQIYLEPILFDSPFLESIWFNFAAIDPYDLQVRHVCRPIIYINDNCRLKVKWALGYCFFRFLNLIKSESVCLQ